MRGEDDDVNDDVNDDGGPRSMMMMVMFLSLCLSLFSIQFTTQKFFQKLLFLSSKTISLHNFERTNERTNETLIKKSHSKKSALHTYGVVYTVVCI